MPPLPTLWDPAGAVDKLPQPFRMIDKVLAEIVEQVVDLIGKREQQRKVEDASRVDLTFAPHAVMEAPHETATFLPVGIAGLAALALPSGEMRLHSARDNSSFVDRTHSSQVTALEAGLVLSTSGRLLAAASRTALSLHEVDIKNCNMQLLASVPLTVDPDDASAPARIAWSDNLGHLAVCFGSGALQLFGVTLPVPNVALENVSALIAMSLASFGPTGLSEILRLPVAGVKAFCLGVSGLGRSHLVWQMQQRPDKNPHSDRYHKSARGAYVWWENANRLLLVDFAAAAKAKAKAAAEAPAAEISAAKPTTPLKGAGSKSQDPATAAASAAAAAAAAAAEADDPGGSGSGSGFGIYKPPITPPVIPSLAPMSRDWLFPHAITAVAATSDRKTLAWGLADGTVFIWDDRSCCVTKTLPRMKGAITALGWVNGVAHRLMCASAEGHIFIADVVKPEDSSQKPYEFPQAIHEVHFLPNEPFALCICRGHTSSDGELARPAGSGAAGGGIGGNGNGGLFVTPAVRPRIFWYNVLDEKPVAELMGPKADQGFGLACCIEPPPLPKMAPRPTTVDPAAATAPGTAAPSAPVTPAPGAAPPTAGQTAAAAAAAHRQEVLAALAAMGADLSKGPAMVPVKMRIPPGTIVEYPAISFRDTYLVVGGDVCDKVMRSNFAEEDDAVPQRVTQLYMYKVDALLRHLLPEDETSTRLGKVVLDRLLADLEAPKAGKKKGKRVKMDVEDPDAPKLNSALRKPDPFEAGGGKLSRAANKHITFGGSDSEGNWFDDLEGKKVFPKETKVFPKETKKGLKQAPGDKVKDGKPRLAPLDLDKAKEAPSTPFAERSQSPPWHHTNPLARIHPDWEEAPVLVRIMDRIGSKGGGRKRREKRLETLTGELMARYAKELGAKPNLLVTD